MITNSIPTNEIPSSPTAPSLPDAADKTGDDAGKDGGTATDGGVQVLDKLQNMLPASNVGIITAVVSLSITLLCAICIAFSKCRKRGRGEQYIMNNHFPFFVEF